MLEQPKIQAKIRELTAPFLETATGEREFE